MSATSDWMGERLHGMIKNERADERDTTADERVTRSDLLPRLGAIIQTSEWNE